MSHNALPNSYKYAEFEFVRTLGDGGFGITYLGWDHSLDKAVAIKEYFPEDWARRDEDGTISPLSERYAGDFDWGKERFLAEAKTLAKFSHPNLVRAYRYFEANGSGYIVMDYLEGEPLDVLLKREETLDAEATRFILERVADGLDSVHQMNFLHRDIKPGNIIISAEDNEPILIDFGAARQTIRNKTQALTAIVTAGYGPHEQYSIEGDNQGPWTDLYALSALGYNLLTGKLPPEGNSRFEDDSFVPLDEKAFGDAPLCRAINQGLMVLTKERPRTAYEWLSIAQSELLRSSQNGNPSKKSRTRRRSKVVKPNNFREKPIKGTSSFTLPPIAPFLLVGAAASLILGGLAWSANQNGVFDKIFDGKMANERPASVSEPQDKGGENDAREEKKTPKERVFTTGQVFRDCSACPEMVVISAGSFLMGSNPSDFGYQKSEGPQRRVTISQNFAIGKYEVTVGDWKNCLAGGGCEGYDPAIAGTDMSRNDYPVSNIPYDAAKFYTSWLSQKTGQNYRLPSEGEWEYAARGGRASIYPWGNSGNTALTSCRNCATKMATPAGSFPPNDFGLFDVVGSLWEWTEDCLNETYDSAPLTPVARTSGDCTSRVIRGGSYNDSLDILRVANRTSVGVSEPRASPHLGFRLYRDIKS